MSDENKPILMQAADGRVYKLGAKETIEVTFKTDGAEVNDKYSITEWRMEQDAPGLDPHVHDTNDELIYVLEGTASVLLDEAWREVKQGGLVVIPAGTQHAFRNDSDQQMALLNIFLSGAYETMMPQIQTMFAQR